VPSNLSTALKAWGSIAQPETAALAPEPSSHQTSCKHSAVQRRHGAQDGENKVQKQE